MMTKTVPACRFFNARTSWLKKRSAFVLKKRRIGHAIAKKQQLNYIFQIFYIPLSRTLINLK